LEWTEYGACGDYEKEVFFPSEEDPETGARRSGASWVKANAKAKLICAGCMVKNQCLWFALDNNEQFGVWGGHTFEERRTLKRFSNWEGLRADAEAEADAIASQTTAA
jgi:WhiB family redox-sensing transcriptional regulator